jgi:hypothetical protein
MNEELKRELQQLLPPLAELDKHFFAQSKDVPENFFRGMEDKFIAQIREKSTPRESQQFSIFSGKKFSYSLAAVSAFAILGLGIFTIVRSEDGSQLSQNEVKSFLEEDGDFLAVDNTAFINPSPELEKISDEEIKNYLCEVEGMDCTQVN